MKRNWFSNFVPFEKPMQLAQGLYFVTPEHYYQAMKSVDFNDQHYVSLARSPGEAKRRGRSIPLRPDWEEVKEAVMEYALRYKFQAVIWRKRLLNTGHEEIVEHNYWHDNIWGDCFCQRCKNIEGHNLLGKLLMKIRTELQKEV